MEVSSQTPLLMDKRQSEMCLMRDSHQALYVQMSTFASFFGRRRLADQPRPGNVTVSTICMRRLPCRGADVVTSPLLAFSLSVLCSRRRCFPLRSLWLSCRTHTPMQTSCWRRPSSLPKRASATPRRSTRPPTSWRTGSKTLFAAWSSARSCWTCPSPSTRTSKR